MPMYDYACRECDHAFEALARSADAAVACPKCAGKRVERQLSMPARPPVKDGPAALPQACMSEGPPCGPVCSRFREE